MSEILYGERCLINAGGVFLMATEVIEDAPLSFRSLIAVNTNIYAATLKVGGATASLSGGWAKTLKLAEVGVGERIRISVRCASSDFTHYEDLEVQVTLEEERVVFTLHP